MGSRIKELRENRGLIQAMLACELGITQQMLSKYERDISVAKVDILKKLSAYFNVTTDYILGISDVKRDLQGQINISRAMDEYFELIELIKGLDEYDRELLFCIVQQMKRVGMKRNFKKTKEESQ